MLHALGWSLLFVLLALWSLAAWALHAVVGWTAANAGALAGGTAVAGAIAMPAWLAPWIPADLAAALGSSLAAMGPAVEWMLNAAPALAGGLSTAIWVIWALGSLALVLLALLGGRILAALRRRGSTLPSNPYTT